MPDKKTIRIHILGGVIDEIENLPDGYNYEVINYDND